MVNFTDDATDLCGTDVQTHYVIVFLGHASPPNLVYIVPVSRDASILFWCLTTTLFLNDRSM